MKHTTKSLVDVFSEIMAMQPNRESAHAPEQAFIAAVFFHHGCTAMLARLHASARDADAASAPAQADTIADELNLITKKIDLIFKAMVGTIGPYWPN